MQTNHPKFGVVIGAIVLILTVGNFFTNQKGTIRASENTPIETSAISLTTTIPKPSIQLPPQIKSPPIVFAHAYTVIDHDTKYPLAAKAQDTPIPIASTTKIMTALVAIERFSGDDVVTISREAATVDGSKVDFMIGEKLTVDNLLYALMLNSANNAAMALAETSGSVDSFVAAMNAKAQLLGLKNTHYMDPAGLNDEGRSTPRDLALLIDHALDNPTFKRLISTATYTISSVDKRYSHELNNSNRLVHSDEPLYLANALGGKTGFTYEAGHCLIASAQFGNKRYVAAILHTTSDTNDASAREARKLLLWASQFAS